MRRFFIGLALAAICVGSTRCEAGALDRIRQDKALRCGSAIRPGLAFPAVDHSWRGLNVDMCRAIAAAIIPLGARVEFSGYVQPADFDRIRTGADDIAFLTTTELYRHALFGAVLTGPTVYEESTVVMVAGSSKAAHLSDLHDVMVCVEPGTAAERGLHDYAALHSWAVNLSGWMELEEMMDAFEVGRCPAVVGEATALAALRLSGAAKGHAGRILPEPLALAPVMAATPVVDPALAQIAAWTINTVLWASRPETAANDQTLTIAGESLGLDRDWQARVIAAGSYSAMYRRSLGADSPLDIPFGPNAGWREGGVLVPLAVQ